MGEPAEYWERGERVKGFTDIESVRPTTDAAGVPVWRLSAPARETAGDHGRPFVSRQHVDIRRVPAGEIRYGPAVGADGGVGS